MPRVLPLPVIVLINNGPPLFFVFDTMNVMSSLAFLNRLSLFMLIHVNYVMHL